MTHQGEDTRDDERKESAEKRHELIKIGNKDGKYDNESGSQQDTNEFYQWFSPAWFRKPALDNKMIR